MVLENGKGVSMQSRMHARSHVQVWTTVKCACDGNQPMNVFSRLGHDVCVGFAFEGYRSVEGKVWVFSLLT